jgi:pyridoxamine 5'-phosphate oxidase
MDFKDCIKFANENKVCYLATMDGDQPRVRCLGMWYADETGFYFQSESNKALCKQIEKNPKVEIYFHAGMDLSKTRRNLGKVMRVYGKVKTIKDLKIRARCIKERPGVKNFGITKPSDPLLAVFQVYTGEAYFWTMADNMKEASIPRIKFGK